MKQPIISSVPRNAFKPTTGPVKEAKDFSSLVPKGEAPATSGMSSRFKTASPIEPTQVDVEPDLQFPTKKKEMPLPKAFSHGDLMRETTANYEPKTAARIHTKTPSKAKGYFRVDLPSHCVPYGFNDVNVRPFKAGDLANIVASRENEDFTLLLDALDNCIDQNIRDLTSGDFRFLMYWWRMNSYPASPYVVNWLSRYGNRNKINVTNTVVGTVELKMTREEYAFYRDLGIKFPTVGDAEAIGISEMPVETRFLADRAQYVELADPVEGIDPLVQRIEILKDKEVSFLEHIRDFMSKTEHGVFEEVVVTDEQFEPKAAIEALNKTSADIMSYLAVQADVISIEAAQNYTDKAKEALDEADEIKTALESGKTDIKPREERIVVNLTTMDFFPEI